jgi:hypothetical protein
MKDKLNQALKLLREAQLSDDTSPKDYGKIDDLMYEIQDLIEGE